MGWISRRNNKTGVHLAHGSKPGKRTGVLRKITGTVFIGRLEYEQLECGHPGRLLSSIGTNGIFGVQEADSRRCMECKKEKNDIKTGL